MTQQQVVPSFKLTTSMTGVWCAHRDSYGSIGGIVPKPHLSFAARIAANERGLAACYSLSGNASAAQTKRDIAGMHNAGHSGIVAARSTVWEPIGRGCL